MTEKEVYLIRHLPTPMNKSGAYMGRDFDPEIIDDSTPDFLRKLDGLREIMDLSKPLLCTSPARRSIQTLEIVRKHFDIEHFEVKIDKNLQETDFGEASGLTVAQIKDKFPDVYTAWITDPSKTSFPGGETYLDVQERSWNALQDLLKVMDHFSSLIICTHVDVMKMILFKAINVPISSKPLVIIPNGGICTFVYQKNNLKLKTLC